MARWLILLVYVTQGLLVAPGVRRLRPLAAHDSDMSSTMTWAIDTVARVRDSFETTRIRVESRLARDIALIQSLVEYFIRRVEIDTTRLLEAAAATENLTFTEVLTLGPSLVPETPPELGLTRRRGTVPSVTIVAAADAVSDATYKAEKRRPPLFAASTTQVRLLSGGDTIIDAEILDEKVEVDLFTRFLRAVDVVFIVAEKFVKFAGPPLADFRDRAVRRARDALLPASTTNLLDGFLQDPPRMEEKVQPINRAIHAGPQVPEKNQKDDSVDVSVEDSLTLQDEYATKQEGEHVVVDVAIVA